MIKNFNKLGMLSLVGLLLCTQNNFVYATDDQVMKESKSIQEVEKSAKKEEIGKSNLLDLSVSMDSEKGKINFGSGTNALLNANKTYILDISANFTNDTSTTKSIEIKIPEGFEVIKYPNEKNINEYPNLLPFFNNSSVVKGNDIYPSVKAEEGVFTINLKPTVTAVDIPINVSLDTRFYRTTLQEDISVSVSEGVQRKTLNGNIQCNDTMKDRNHPEYDMKKNASLDEWNLPEIYELYVTRMNDQGNSINPQANFLCDEVIKEFIAPTGTEFKTKDSNEKVTTHDLGNGTTKFIVKSGTSSNIGSSFFRTSGYWKFPSSVFNIGDNPEVTYTRATYKLHGHPVKEVLSGSKIIYSIMENYEDVQVRNIGYGVDWVRKSIPNNEYLIFTYDISNKGINDSVNKEIVLNFEQTDLSAITGFYIPKGSLTEAGDEYVVKEISFKTTKSNTWKTVEGIFEKRINREDLGIIDDDEYFTEVKFNIGEIPKGVRLDGDPNDQNRCGVYGKIFKNPTDHPDLFKNKYDKYTNIKPKASIEVKSVEGNKSTGKIEMNASLLNTKFDVYLSMYKSISKVAGDTLRLEYANSEFSKAVTNRPNIYLRSEGKLDFINFKIINDGKDITNQCLITLDHKETNGTFVYKISMKNVIGEDGIVGEYKGKFKKLNVSFDVHSSKDFSGGTWDLHDLIFLEDTENFNQWDNNFNSDPFDVNNNKKIDDQNIKFFKYASNEKTYSIIPRKTFFSDTSAKSKSETDEAYRNFNNEVTTNIVKVQDTAQMKVDLYNKGAQVAKEAVIYLPVPKIGINYGALFQEEDFKWSMKLDTLLSSNDDYEISYANIVNIPSGGITTDQLKNYDYIEKEHWVKDLSDINMIRIKTKKEVQANDLTSFVFEFSQDGKKSKQLNKETAMNIFNVYQYFDLTGMAEGSSGYKKGDKLAFQSDIPNEYSVNFETNGGTAIGAIKTIDGEKINKPVNPSKLGSTFMGWYKDQAFTTEWNFAVDVVNGDTTLYAKWDAIVIPTEYTVNFETNGGTAIGAIKTIDGEKINKPVNPSKLGSTFMGWYKDQAFTKEWDFAVDVVNGNTTLYAKWDAIVIPNEYTVNFETNGGTKIDAIKTIDGGKIKEPTNPSKEGFTFMGWYKDQALTKEWDFAVDVVNGDTKLYAKWNAVVVPNEYTVNFETNGGTKIDATKTIDGEKIKEPTNPSKEGFTFMGWYKDQALTKEWDFAVDVVNGDTKLYAKWDAIVVPNEYTVNFETNGGMKIDTIKTIDGEKIKEPTNPSKEGFTFMGWYKDQALTKEWDFAVDVVNGDTKLYAKWNAVVVPNEYTVNFETNGGTKIDATKTIDGEKIKEPTNPAKEGFKFMGWYEDQAFTKEWDFAVDVVNGDTTLYAKWDAVDKPVKPIEPVKPAEPDKPTKTETPEIEVIEKPNTGITTKMSIYLAFGLLSGCSLVAFAIIKRNKKTNR